MHILIAGGYTVESFWEIIQRTSGMSHLLQAVNLSVLCHLALNVHCLQDA